MRFIRWATVLSSSRAARLFTYALAGGSAGRFTWAQVKQRREPPLGAFREAARWRDHRGMTTAVLLRRRFPGTCGTGLAQRLTDSLTCGNHTLRFLRYPS